MRRQDDLAGVPTLLWRTVALAQHRLLMLDYDGTLAPFAIERHEAYPLPRCIELLRRIIGSKKTTVAIVSGRPLRELQPLTGALPAILVGEHGWERCSPDGGVIRCPLEHSVASAIDAAERWACDAGLGRLVERKHASVMLHTRALPEATARVLQARCHEAWSRLAKGGGIALDRIDGGVEIRARGRNKGTAALSLVSQAIPGTLGVFIGDDVTDEDAFDVVRDWGFGVKVGDFNVPSIAQGRLESCESVPAFLEEWLRIIGAA